MNEKKLNTNEVVTESNTVPENDLNENSSETLNNEDQINEENKNSEELEQNKTDSVNKEDVENREEILKKEHEKLVQEIEKSKKESLWSKIKKVVKAVVMTPVNYLIVKPATWVGDQLTMAFMPKESKTKLYDEAIKRAYEEKEKQLKEATKEDAKTTSKKMQIIRNQEKDDIQQMKELAKLCHESKQNVVVKTELGAFRFEKVGNTVVIKHANPIKRTMESPLTYDFQTIGGVVFNKLGSLNEKETDLYDAVKQLRMDKGFDIHTRELDVNAIVESNLIVDVDPEMANGKTVELENETEINEAILDGNADTVIEDVLQEIDTPDYVANDENVIDLKPMEMLTPEQLEELMNENNQNSVELKPLEPIEPLIKEENETEINEADYLVQDMPTTAHYSKNGKIDMEEEYESCYTDSDEIENDDIGKLIQAAQEKLDETKTPGNSEIIQDEHEI